MPDRITEILAARQRERGLAEALRGLDESLDRAFTGGTSDTGAPAGVSMPVGRPVVTTPDRFGGLFVAEECELEDGDYLVQQSVEQTALDIQLARLDESCQRAFTGGTGERADNRVYRLADLEAAELYLLAEANGVPFSEVAARIGGSGGRSGMLTESRTPVQTRCTLVERAGGVTGTKTGLLSVVLIDEGSGSSGYYPAATLQEAARQRIFPAGLHCYLDHPTESERYERPERSVRDLAGVLESDATYVDGALTALVRTFPPHDELIASRADAIGMSIRAEGSIGSATMAGQPIVESLTKAHSVDFVTLPGRGGRILGAAA